MFDHGALDALAVAFGLSPFERGVIAVCAEAELQATAPPPTVASVLRDVPGGSWPALSPAGALRRWRLVELGPAPTLAGRTIRLAERTLLELTGAPQLDDDLASVLDPVGIPPRLPPSHVALAERVAGIWRAHADHPVPPLVHVVDGDPTDRAAISATAAAQVGSPLYELGAEAIPTDPSHRDELSRLWEREAVLSGATVLIAADDDADPMRHAALVRFATRTAGRVLVSGGRPLASAHRRVVAVEVGVPPPPERRALWEASLGDAATSLADDHLDRLAEHFAIGATAIERVCRSALDLPPGAATGAALWDACRAAGRARLADVAECVTLTAHWDDLVVAEAQRAVLREIVANVRHRALVHEAWGFAADNGAGLGVTALFAGASGTGKTMAAETVAGELGLALHRIDLSAIVSKYIGETEKNLSRVFAAAEGTGAVLLFDEADALFGKRSAVRDSHDRYANIEVSYLLQRMESYRGLAILTTNMPAAIDASFLRRVRFVVQFPFPGASQREEIWRRSFPVAAPVEGLAFDRLAALQFTGGSIRTVAVRAAFLAADDGGTIRMGHVAAAARAEYAKLEKTPAAAELDVLDAHPS